MRQTVWLPKMTLFLDLSHYDQLEHLIDLVYLAIFEFTKKNMFGKKSYDMNDLQEKLFLVQSLLFNCQQDALH